MRNYLVLGMVATLAACGGSAREQVRTASNVGPGTCRGDGDCGAGERCANERCVTREVQPSYAPAVAHAMAPGAAPSCAPQPVYFAFDRSNLDPRATRTADDDAVCIEHSHRGEHLVIIGHTDPRGTTEYNLALGQARAESMTRQLERNGVPRGAITTQSVGAEYATGHDEATWAQDRRDSFNQP